MGQADIYRKLQKHLDLGLGRRITRDEALAHLGESRKEGLVLQPSNTRDAEFLCSCCGICVKRCQVKAVSMDAKSSRARVDMNLCMGCGVCVPTCAKQALTLRENPRTMEPPKSIEDLFDRIMEKKKGRLGKLGVALKLALDAVRTGRLEVLKL